MHKNFIIYKPYGYLSQFKSNDRKQQRKKFLGDLHNFPEGIMAIGRLDEKSEGLLLLTTDGKTSDYFNSSNIEKEYLALVDGDITQSAVRQMASGILIGLKGEKYLTKPCRVMKLTKDPILPIRSKKIRDARHGPVSWISVTLKEGKFRQVRKMTSAIGFPTLRLVRIRIGDFMLNDMTIGEVRKLSRSIY